MDKKILDTDYESLFEKEIKELLLYHKIVEATKTGEQSATVKLDNGTVLNFYGNEGCGGCGNGWFYIDKFLTDLPDNAITDVKFEITSDEYSDEHFNVYIFHEESELNLISYSGYDNGYYGTGFTIEAELA